MGTALVNPLEVGMPKVAIVLQTPTADEWLLTHCHAILLQAQPGLSAPSQSLKNTLTQMATAILNRTNDNHQMQEQKILADQKPKNYTLNVSLPLFPFSKKLLLSGSFLNFGTGGQTEPNCKNCKLHKTRLMPLHEVTKLFCQWFRLSPQNLSKIY
jgi:hypothetical protein